MKTVVIIAVGNIIFFDVFGVSHQPAIAQIDPYCDRYAKEFAHRRARGGALEGAADGAIGGLIGGLIFGDVGGTAALGAGIGALAGGASQSREERYLYARAYDDCIASQSRQRPNPYSY